MADFSFSHLLIILIILGAPTFFLWKAYQSFDLFEMATESEPYIPAAIFAGTSLAEILTFFLAYAIFSPGIAAAVLFGLKILFGASQLICLLILFSYILAGNAKKFFLAFAIYFAAIFIFSGIEYITKIDTRKTEWLQKKTQPRA